MPMLLMWRHGQGHRAHPTPTPIKDTGLHASLPLQDRWEVGQPRRPGPSPRWSFLYSHHGLSVSVALMSRPRCGANVFIATTHFRLGLEPLTKFSLQGSFLGGASQD